MMDATYGLALSGGGFRATFFHLGVIEELRKQGRLEYIRHITGVSGGAITAAHLWLNWEQYVSGDERDFENLVEELRVLALSGLQNRILKRVFWRSVFGLPVSASDWLVDEYQSLYRGATLGLRISHLADSCPRLSILSTSLRSGLPVVLDSIAIMAVLGGDPDIGMPRHPDMKRALREVQSSSSVSLAQAVVASSAHPALFSPLHLNSSELSDLTDGGIHDNLGIVWMDELCPQHAGYDFTRLLVSDAGAKRNFKSELGMQQSSDLRKHFNRNMAAVDLIMRHLDETRHKTRQRDREYFHICTRGDAPWSPDHPALLPTTFNSLGEINLEALRNHGRFVVADQFVNGVQ